MLRIVADENIVFAREAFGGLGELRLLPAQDITPGSVGDADVLLVRSVTHVDARFAALRNLRFVGTATIGTDHFDGDALRAAGISVHAAPGSNAESVVEYVLAALLQLAATRGESLRGRTAGVVGCGSIGGRVAARLPALGLRVLRNDPPLARRAEADGAAHPYVPLEQVLAECDVVTLHVPLTRSGPDATQHLIGARELACLRPDAWLLNTSRGAVVDNHALHAALGGRASGATALDVWEHEPRFDPALVPLVDIATPHIAGHSFDGKVNGTIMLHDALVHEFGLVSHWDPEAALAATAEDRLALEPSDIPAADQPEAAWLHALVRLLYPIARDDARMRTLLALHDGERALEFQRQRSRYPRRRSFHRFSLPAAAVPPAFRDAVRDALGVRLR